MQKFRRCCACAGSEPTCRERASAKGMHRSSWKKGLQGKFGRLSERTKTRAYAPCPSRDEEPNLEIEIRFAEHAIQCGLVSSVIDVACQKPAHDGSWSQARSFPQPEIKESYTARVLLQACQATYGSEPGH